MGVQLAPEGRSLALDWAANVGDITEPYEFEVPTDEATDAYSTSASVSMSERFAVMLLLPTLATLTLWPPATDGS
jgi:hypothetical protein